MSYALACRRRDPHGIPTVRIRVASYSYFRPSTPDPRHTLSPAVTSTVSGRTCRRLKVDLAIGPRPIPLAGHADRRLEHALFASGHFFALRDCQLQGCIGETGVWGDVSSAGSQDHSACVRGARFEAIRSDIPPATMALMRDSGSSSVRAARKRIR